MRISNNLLFVGVLVASLLPISAQSEAVTRAAMLANSCALCHGTDGKGSGKIPKLQGEDVEDLRESLYGFQSGAEKSTIMDRHAKAYTDEEIRLVTEYFSRLSD